MQIKAILKHINELVTNVWNDNQTLTHIDKKLQMKLRDSSLNYEISLELLRSDLISIKH